MKFIFHEQFTKKVSLKSETFLFQSPFMVIEPLQIHH